MLKAKLIEATSFILNKSLREYVKNKLETAPDYFYNSGASGTLKHHPQATHKEGGLMLHTYLVFQCAKELALMPMFNLKRKEVDIVLAAALLHDIYKQGVEDCGGPTRKDHGKICYEIVLADGFPEVAKCVLTHLAEHGKNQPYTPAERILAMADRVMSRTWLNSLEW